MDKYSVLVYEVGKKNPWVTLTSSGLDLGGMYKEVEESAVRGWWRNGHEWLPPHRIERVKIVKVREIQTDE